jgi:hypothetical protein
VADELDGAVEDLRQAGLAAAERAFIRALGNVKSVARDLCPVGHTQRKRGFGGRAGGALQSSLHVEYLGRAGDQLLARCTSTLPYAGVQHEIPYHHPGLYTGGSAGPVFKAKYFERAVEIIFGSGADPLGDPGRQLNAVPDKFADLLKDETEG